MGINKIKSELNGTIFACVRACVVYPLFPINSNLLIAAFRVRAL